MKWIKIVTKVFVTITISLTSIIIKIIINNKRINCKLVCMGPVYRMRNNKEKEYKDKIKC